MQHCISHAYIAKYRLCHKWHFHFHMKYAEYLASFAISTSFHGNCDDMVCNAFPIPLLEGNPSAACGLFLQDVLHNSMVSCQKGPTRHAYAWQIGPFGQDTFELRLHTFHFKPYLIPSARITNINRITIDRGDHHYKQPEGTHFTNTLIFFLEKIL